MKYILGILIIIIAVLGFGVYKVYVISTSITPCRIAISDEASQQILESKLEFCGVESISNLPEGEQQQCHDSYRDSGLGRTIIDEADIRKERCEIDAAEKMENPLYKSINWLLGLVWY